MSEGGGEETEREQEKLGLELGLCSGGYGYAVGVMVMQWGLRLCRRSWASEESVMLGP